MGSGGLWYGPKLREYQIAVIGVKFNMHVLAYSHRLWGYAHQLGDQARAFFELDQGDGIRVLKRRHLGVMHHHKGVHRAASAGGDGVPLKRVALRADWAGRVAQGAAGCAALDTQLAQARAFPEKPSVVADAGRRALVRWPAR